MRLLTIIAVALLCSMNAANCVAGTFNSSAANFWDASSVGSHGNRYAVPSQHEVGIGCNAGCTVTGGQPSFDNCFSGNCAAPCANRSWFATAGAIALTRDQEDDILFGFDDANPSTRLTLHDGSMDYTAGFETHIGRYFGDCWAVEGVYWGIDPHDQYSHLYAADMVGNIVSPIEFNFLEYDNGTGAAPADSYFDNSQVLRIVRVFEYHNLELNFWRRACLQSCRSDFRFLVGARYMQINELLDLDTDVANNAFGDDIVNELFYDINVDNYLIGFQVGGQYDRRLTERVSFEVGSKIGLFGNHINHRQTLWGGNGSALISATSPLGYGGSAYSSNRSKDDVSFLAELMFGVTYDVSRCWQLNMGYRAVAITGVALPSGQIPLRFDDLAAVNDINTGDSLVLHGAYAGVGFNW